MAPNPAYSPYLGFAPTFNYYGRSWGASDQDAFFKALRRHGVNINAWLKNHPTAGKVFSPIEQLLYANLQPQIHALQEVEKQKQDFLHRQLMDIGGFYNALQGNLAGIGPYVGGQYKQGANTMGAAGEGYGAVLNETQAANAAGQNATLEALNSPARTEGGDAGSVLSGLAGWIPQSMLNQQGPAYADALATLPASASLEAQIMAKGILEQAQQSQTDTQNSIMDIITGAPALRQQYQSQISDQQMAQQKFQLDQLQEERDWYLKQQALAISEQNMLISQGRLKLAAEAGRRAEEAGRRADAATQRMNNSSAGLDYWGNPQPVKPSKPSTSSTTPGTPAWRQKQVDRVADINDDIERDVAKAFEKNQGAATVITKSMQTALIQALIKKYMPFYGTTPTAKKLLKKAITQAVRRWSPKPPTGTSTAPPTPTQGAPNVGS